MSDAIVIHVESAEVQRVFGELLRRSQDLSPLMQELSEYLLESTQRRFDTSTAPDGTLWPALKDGSGRKPLVKTGTLRDQIPNANVSREIR